MSHKSLIQAPSHYTNYPANADLAYDSICKVLSDRQDQIPWEQFGANEWQLLAQMAKACPEFIEGPKA